MLSYSDISSLNQCTPLKFSPEENCRTEIRAHSVFFYTKVWAISEYPVTLMFEIETFHSEKNISVLFHTCCCPVAEREVGKHPIWAICACKESESSSMLLIGTSISGGAKCLKSHKNYSDTWNCNFCNKVEVIGMQGCRLYKQTQSPVSCFNLERVSVLFQVLFFAIVFVYHCHIWAYATFSLQTHGILQDRCQILVKTMTLHNSGFCAPFTHFKFQENQSSKFQLKTEFKSLFLFNFER